MRDGKTSGPGERLRIQWAGPGLIMAVSGIGASDVISATVGGARHGLTLLWTIGLGVFLKFVLTEGLARWQVASGTTILEGWARHLPRWVIRLFFCYLVLWSIAVGGALLSGCGLALQTISHGRIPFVWGALAHGVFAFLFLAYTRGTWFAAAMKPLIAIMFFSAVLCVVLILRHPGEVLRGLLVPTIPVGGGPLVLSLVGGIGGSLTLLSYSYLLREENHDQPANLSRIRLDLALAYVFTAIFGLSIAIIAARVFHDAGIVISDRDAVSRMAGQLALIIGPAGFYIYAIGFWAAVLASLMGVWQTVPHIFADCWPLLRGGTKPAASASKSRIYQRALAFMAAAALPFAFLGRPLFLVVAFTIIGSFFIPFLAGTLLRLNTRAVWPAASGIRRNGLATNAALVIALLLFLVLGGIEIGRLF